MFYSFVLHCWQRICETKINIYAVNTFFKKQGRIIVTQGHNKNEFIGVC